MFEIDFAPEAWEDLRWFRKRDQTIILDGIEEQLRYQPTEETRNRKKLRKGHVSEWELRLDKVRVFYDVAADAGVVTIAAIGYKERSKLYFRGEEHSP